MKKIAVILWLMMCGTAFAAKYPELDVCTGENVRLRESPGTDGKILGVIEPDRNIFVILGEARANGMKWYEIDHPTQEGSAYIAADYVKRSNYSDEITGEHFVNIRQTFGNYPEKTRALFGKGRKNESHWRGDLEYLEGFTIAYDENGMLKSVDVLKRGISIAGVKVGDRIEKLINLGMPEAHAKEFYDYDDDYEYVWWLKHEASQEEMCFMFDKTEDGRAVISSIYWGRVSD